MIIVVELGAVVLSYFLMAMVVSVGGPGRYGRSAKNRIARSGATFKFTSSGRQLGWRVFWGCMAVCNVIIVVLMTMGTS